MEVGVFESARSSHISSFTGLKSSKLSKVKLVFHRKHLGRRSYRCCGAANMAGSMPVDWKPALDEIVLMSSILLAYVAGIVDKPFGSFSGFRTLKPTFTNETASEKKEQSSETRDIEAIWDRLDEKLLDDGTPVEFAIETSPVLYLQALDYGPRIRLLLTASKLIRNESTRKRSSPVSLNELCSMAGKICRRWISDESTRVINVPAGFLTTSMANVGIEALTVPLETEAKQYTLKCLERGGKVELYSEFLMILTRPASDEVFNAKLAQNILEDMLIVASEGAAAMYLNAVAGMRAGWSPLLHPSISSTRALERFRNRVALQQWIHHNFDSVAAIYEDRVELWVMNCKPQELEGELRLSRLNIRVRRSWELRELSGWRLFYSLYLEFYDIVGPLVRMMVSKVGQGLSFLLVCLIGRSFGLIYQGIRQSVKWSSSD